MNPQWRRSIQIATTLVTVLMGLAYLRVLTPLPFLFLLPGILVAIVSPDSHFSPEAGEQSPWPGPVAILLLLVVNSGCYTLIVRAILKAFDQGEKAPEE